MSVAGSWQRCRPSRTIGAVDDAHGRRGTDAANRGESRYLQVMAQSTVLVCQLDVPPMVTGRERDAHLDRTQDRLRQELRARPADLVVLPELSSLHYSKETFEQLDDLAEPLDGPSYRAMGDVASEFGATVLFGIARRDGTNTFITQVAVGPDGEFVGHYDKLHRADFGYSTESDFFTSSGDALFVFECGGVRFAPIICYDIRFPELTRTLVIDHHIDVVLHCAAFGRDESFDSWHSFVITRAMENQVPFLSLNRAGELYGDSIFCGPWADSAHPAIHFPAYAEAFEFLEISTADTAMVREKYRFLEDRIASYRHLPSDPQR